MNKKIKNSKLHGIKSSQNEFNSSNIMIKNKRRLDAYTNALSGFGGQYDPIERLTYNYSEVLSTGTIELLYRQDWLSRKIIETIPDCLRKWIDIYVPDNEIVLDLQKKIKQLDAINKFKEALINARLYGGSIIILGIPNSGSPNKRLNYDKIDDILYLNVINRTGLQIHSYYKDPLKENYGEPEYYRIQTIYRPDNFDPNKYIIHESRVLRFDGNYLPELTRKTNSGWHDSILNGINQTLKQYGTSIQSCAILFQDFISKILKMPNLTELLQSDEGRQVLELRIQYAIANLSSLGMVLIGENEEFNKVQTPVAGLSELMDKFIEIASASSNTPRTRLFGQSLGTLAGATETTRAYYDYCTAYQSEKLYNQINKLIKVLLNRKNGINKGREPNEWSFKFNSLWDATDKEVTTARKMQAQVDDIYIEKKVITPEEVAISRFRKDGYSFDTIVDINHRIGEFYEEIERNNLNSENNNLEERIDKDIPKEIKNILYTIYFGCRSKWIKLNPNDKENESNKSVCLDIAWAAVKEAGWRKDKSGKWIKTIKTN